MLKIFYLGPLLSFLFVSVCGDDTEKLHRHHHQWMPALVKQCPFDSLRHLRKVFPEDIKNLSIAVVRVPDNFQQSCLTMARAADWTVSDVPEYFMDIMVHSLIAKHAGSYGVRVDEWPFGKGDQNLKDFYYVPIYTACKRIAEHSSFKPDNTIVAWLSSLSAGGNLTGIMDMRRVDTQLTRILTTIGSNFGGDWMGSIFEHVAVFTYECYSTHNHNRGWTRRDVVVPYPVQGELADFNTSPRPSDFFFLGTLNRANGGGIIRNRLRDVFAKDAKSQVGNSINATAYVAGMRKSKFCLVPRGDTFTTKHLFNAIADVCVPVIVSDPWDGATLPFSRYLEWESFSYRIPEQFLEPQYEALLQERINFIRNDVAGLAERQRVLRDVRHFFVFGSGNALLPTFKPSKCMLLLLLQNLVDIKLKSRLTWR